MKRVWKIIGMALLILAELAGVAELWVWAVVGFSAEIGQAWGGTISIMVVLALGAFMLAAAPA